MAEKLTLTFDANGEAGSFGKVTVQNLPPELLVRFHSDVQPPDPLRSIFRVSVAPTGRTDGDALPGVFGRYAVVGGSLQFTPHFPFERGLSYRAIFDPRPFGRTDLCEALTLTFALPKAPSTVAAEVQHIFPSSDALPDNLLRFYVTFSNSMQRGQAQKQIALLGPGGEPVQDVLYRAPVELWDRRMKCLTVLLDPGRLKRRVGPHRELGPPLKAGDRYTLVIGSGILDISGSPLREAGFKHFTAVDAVREKIAVERWQIVPPATHTREPLVLLFQRPLDWALLASTIAVTSTEAGPIDGRIVVDRCEQRWTFTPALPWIPGSHNVQVGSTLEDVCGNSLSGAFDRPFRPGRTPSDDSASHLIAFHLP